jgi:aromatic-L-amino-acid decarboxylase
VRVVDELTAATAGSLLQSSGGRFFAWVIGGALPSALAADWLTSTWDQNAVLHACSPAAAVAEEVAGAWLKEILDLPREASFAFTTGCQLAHFVGLAAARQAVLRDAGWDLDEHGLAGAPPVRLLVNEFRHRSVDRALKYLGFGRRSVEQLGVDAEGRVRAHTLAPALRAGKGPAILVLNAGDINTAAIDPFAELIPLAREHGAWVHVDGAFGLIARASAARRKLLAGLEGADSWASDAHKWLNVPFDCGLAFVRDSAAHRAAMTARAEYIEHHSEVREPIDWTPEWSRRARGFVVYAALRELGRNGLENLVERCCEHAAALVDGLAALPGAQVLHKPELNQGLVRFLDRRPTATEADHDRRTEAVIGAVNASGETFFSATTWRQRRAMRVSVVNWRTTAEDVQRTLAACARTVADLSPKSASLG